MGSFAQDLRQQLEANALLQDADADAEEGKEEEADEEEVRVCSFRLVSCFVSCYFAAGPFPSYRLRCRVRFRIRVRFRYRVRFRICFRFRYVRCNAIV